MIERGRLPRHLHDLLQDVVRARCPDLSDRFERLGPLALTKGERLRVAEALTAEFCATGLLPSFEPNARGLLLERLIDFIWVTPLKEEHLRRQGQGH